MNARTRLGLVLSAWLQRGLLVAVAGLFLAGAAQAQPCTIQLGQGNQTVDCGSSLATISVGPNGGGPFTYSWTGPNGFTSSVQAPLFNTTGTYTCTITGTNCTGSANDAVTITVNPLDQMANAGPNRTKCAGETIQLNPPNGGVNTNNNLNGTGPYTYSWSPSTGLSDHGETTSSIQVGMSGTYTVNVTDANGCSGTSSAVNTTAIPYVNASVTISSNAPATVLPSTSITFTASHTGGGTVPTFQWKRNGVNVGTNSTTYTGSSWSNGDVITCVMTSNATCVNGSPATSNAISLTVTVVTPKFVITDIIANKAFYYDATFNFIQSNNLSSTGLNGIANANDLAFASTFAYVLDVTNKRILRSAAAGTASTASRSLRTNTGSTLGTPTGLAVSGDTLWVLDQKGRAVYRYSLSAAFTGTGTINASAKITLSTQNTAGESLMASGPYLYVLNNGTTKVVYRYPKAGGTAVLSRSLLNTGGTALSKVTGLVLEAGTTVYITDNGLDRVLQYSLSTMYSGTTALNASASYIMNSGNGNSTGIALTSSTGTLRDGEDELTVGAEEIVMTAYPNPTSGLIHLVIKGKTDGEFLLTAYDMTGRKVAETVLSDDNNLQKEEEFDLSYFGKGIYLVVLSKGEYRQTVRVIVQ